MELWLKESTEILRNFGYKQDIWEDFLTWAVYRSGWNVSKPYTVRSKTASTERQYRCLYQIIGKTIQDDPHRNVLLELMAAIGFASPNTQYNEKLAKDILIAKIDQEASAKQPGVDNGLARPAAWDCAGHDDFDRYLAIWSVDNMIIHDCHCEDSGGSMLIAMANVLQGFYESYSQDRALLIASDSTYVRSTAAMIAFIQLSIMGAASYVLMDNTFGVNNRRKMALFAPPNAICTKLFFSETWDNARMASMVWGLTYGAD